MNLRIICSIIVLVLFLVLFVSYSLAFCKEIDLNISLNKTEFHVNDKIDIKINILNNSSKRIRILPWMGPYENNWIVIENDSGAKQIAKEKVIYEIDPQYPYKDSYFLIYPNNLYSLDLNGKIVKDELTGFLSIEFPRSKINLSKNKEFIIKAVFENDGFIAKEAKDKFGFDDVWRGKAVSNSLRFSVSE